MTYHLKWTRKGRIPSYQGGQPLPQRRRWTPTINSPILCQRGWHACRWEDTVRHISDELWICELDGLIVEGDDKAAAQRLRLIDRAPVDDRILRLFAADCAEQVLPIFERRYPDDLRPRDAIAVARRCANGDATRRGLAAAGDAAGDAAWAAARDAARAAARAAAGEWQTHRLLIDYCQLDPTLFAHRKTP